MDQDETVDPSGETDLALGGPRGQGDTSDKAGRVDVALAKERARNALFGFGQKTRVGRFTLLEEIGRGGMGVVFAAHDPELDRRVAIKVMPRRSDKSRARALSEARALARLAHPNIVEIYDTGTHRSREGDEVMFLAMELIDGQTLGAWVANARPSPEEIVAAYVQAARGLAAVHARGLVHRDFKPANAMRDRDGRVRVMDFGIAVAPIVGSDDPFDAATDRDIPGAPEHGVTAPGQIAGTLAYIAPERVRGENADPRSDQFSWCVSLYEALVGRRPLDADTPYDLVRGLLSDAPLPSVPVDAQVSQRVRSVLARGLLRAPQRRWASMDEIIKALAPPRSRRTMFAAAAGAIAVGIASWFGAQTGGSACGSVEQPMKDAWSSTSRADALRAIEQSSPVLGPKTKALFGAAVDDYSRAWREQATNICQAAQADESTAPRDWDLRRACLRRSLDAMEAAVSTAKRVDAESVQYVPTIVEALPRLASCTDLPALRSRLPPPASTEDAETVARARTVLTQAEFAMTAGRYDEARALVERARTTAGVVEYGPLIAEASMAAADLADLEGDIAAAEALAESAVLVATEFNHDEVVAEATTALAGILSDSPERAREAAHWVEFGSAAIARLGEPPEFKIEFAVIEGIAAQTQGRPRDAVEAYLRALESARALDGTGPLRLARLHRNLASGQLALHDLPAALRSAERALELTSTLPSEHPDQLSSRNAVATVLLGMGREKEAGEQLREVTEAQARLHGASHPRTLRSRSNYAVALARQDELDAAQEILEENLRRLDLDPNSAPKLRIYTLSILGTVLDSASDDARALEVRRRVAVLLEEQGPSPGFAEALSDLAGSLDKLDDPEAKPTAQRSLAMFEETLGADHSNVAFPLGVLARIEAKAGNLEAAVEFRKREAEIRRNADGANHPVTHEAVLRLAELLEQGERCSEAAVELARLMEAELEPEDRAEASLIWAQCDPDDQRARPKLEQALALCKESCDAKLVKRMEALLATAPAKRPASAENPASG